MSSVATWTHEYSASREFSLDNSVQLQFALKDGEWCAYTTELNGCFARATCLPVVCKGNQDPSSVLKALFKQPRSYVKQRVHVLDARPSFAATRFVFVGQLGLLGGMPNRANDGFSAVKKIKPLTLLELIEKKKIVSTIDLVRAFNEATPSKKAALNEWVHEYVKWLNESTVGNSVENSGAYLNEYALLAKVFSRKAIHKDFCRAQFKALVQKVLEDQIGQESLMESLETCLNRLDKSILKDKAILHTLGSGLLSRLDPDKYPMMKYQFNLRHCTFFCCYLVLSLIKECSPSSAALDRDNRQSLYSQFYARMESICRRAKYYPYTFHAQLLMVRAEKLQAEKVVGVGVRLKQGMSGAVGIYRSGVALATGDVEGFVDTVGNSINGKGLMRMISSSCSAVVKKIDNMVEGEVREWHELCRAMYNAARNLLAEEYRGDANEETHEELIQVRKEVMKHLAKERFPFEKEAKALSFAMIDCYGRIALKSQNRQLRKSYVEFLRSLIDPKQKPDKFKCLEEYGLCEVYLDQLAKIACYGIEESDRVRAKEALKFAFEVARSSGTDPVRANVSRWSRNKDLDTRLASVPPLRSRFITGDLYEIIIRRLALKHGIPSKTVECVLKKDGKANRFENTWKTTTENIEAAEVDHKDEEEEEDFYDEDEDEDYYDEDNNEDEDEDCSYEDYDDDDW